MSQVHARAQPVNECAEPESSDEGSFDEKSSDAENSDVRSSDTETSAARDSDDLNNMSTAESTPSIESLSAESTPSISSSSVLSPVKDTVRQGAADLEDKDESTAPDGSKRRERSTAPEPPAGRTYKSHVLSRSRPGFFGSQ